MAPGLPKYNLKSGRYQIDLASGRLDSGRPDREIKPEPSIHLVIIRLETGIVTLTPINAFLTITLRRDTVVPN